MRKNINILFFIALMVGVMTSCSKDVLDPTLAGVKDVEGSITSAEDVEGVLLGAYNRLTSTNYYGRDLIIFNEVRSDNAFANGNSGRFLAPGQMDMTEDNGYARDSWTAMYRVVASANIIIGLDAANLTGDADVINQMVGQAFALRALAHFDLLKLFGQQHTGGTMGVPYITEYKGEELTPPRNSVTEVHAAIQADISTALSMMKNDVNDGSKQLLTTYGVQALKSRVGTYFGDWPSVVSASEAIINSQEYQILEATDYVGSWVIDAAANSIFELAYSSTDNNNINGLSQIYRGGDYGDIQVLEEILTIFDAGDIRVDEAMIGMGDGTGVLRNMGKYPSSDYSDNISIFRYEEVVLNYAEALLEASGASDALTQLNSITAKRGALPYATANKENILNERRREFCFEGFRFDDLARSGKDIPVVDEVNQTHGGPAYGSYNYAFPIPRVELNANSNMVQNSGY
jgi:hypothetical protein